ncbi:MAG: glycine zipper 2TM domain-containing protein [Proteobacteria bacterium]|nr:glycine zipper 2TM domain-containing protein [Pseudomonadota bacterium]
MQIRTPALLLLVASIGLAACSASAPSGSVYKSGEALKPQEVKLAKLLSVRVVQIETSSNTNTGAIAGGAIGGVAGSQMGSGRGSEALLGGLIGATVGAIAGSATEKMANKSDALELTVKMDDTGQIMSIVQASDETFTAGQQVRVLIQSGKYRVAPY